MEPMMSTISVFGSNRLFCRHDSATTFNSTQRVHPGTSRSFSLEVQHIFDDREAGLANHFAKLPYQIKFNVAFARTFFHTQRNLNSKHSISIEKSGDHRHSGLSYLHSISIICTVLYN